MPALALLLALYAVDQPTAVLIHQLADDHYDAREDAGAALARRMPGAFLSVAVAANSDDLERSRRCVDLCRKAINDFYDVRPSRYRCMPQFDFMDTERFPTLGKGVKPPEVPKLFDFQSRNELVNAFLYQARTHCCRVGPDYEEYRGATVLYVRDLLNCGVSKQSVRKLLDDLAAVEEKWYESNHWTPPG